MFKINHLFDKYLPPKRSAVMLQVVPCDDAADANRLIVESAMLIFGVELVSLSSIFQA